MDATRDYHTKWSKPYRERQISYDITYLWNLKIWRKGTCLWNRNRLMNTEVRLVVAKGKRHGERKDWKWGTQFSSVAQLCPTLCDPMNRSTPGLPVHHQLPEFTQTHVHQVGDAIPPSHPVVPFSSSPQSLPASGSFPVSQPFTWGGQSIGVSASASVLPMNTQDWSPLGWTGWTSLQFKGLLRVFSNTTVQEHQFFSAHLSSQSNSHIHTWLLEKP